MTAPVQAHDSNITAPEMPTVTAKLREAVINCNAWFDLLDLVAAEMPRETPLFRIT